MHLDIKISIFRESQPSSSEGRWSHWLTYDRTWIKTIAHGGFSLVEVLIALVVFGIAATTTLVFFSNSLRSIYRTGSVSEINASIESDIARIKQLAEEYNACMPPTGTADSGSTTLCSGSGQTWPDGTTPIQFGDAWYYYPSTASSTTLRDAFLDACASPTKESHITNNLIEAIEETTPPSGATRTVTREAPSDALNHVIMIRYQSAVGGIDRLLKIVPVVSSWCP